MKKHLPWLIPLLAGVLGCLLVLIFRADRWLDASIRLSALVLALGLLIAGGIQLVLHFRRRNLNRRQQAEDAARKQERDSKNRFLQRLEHELKNPVTAIMTALANEEDHSPSLHMVNTQVRRIRTLVTDLAKLVDIENYTLEREPVNLEELVLEVLEVTGGTEQRVDLEFPKVPWPIPMVPGDRDLLSVVLHNLISNALKYSDPDARIEIRASETGNAVRLEVNDNGWGIPEEGQQIVWEELARADHGHLVEGSGLGLAIVRTIVERHGGAVELASQAGVGSRFAITLPTGA